MKNIQYQIRGNRLFIQVDLGFELGESESGKHILIANSGGCVPLKNRAEKINLVIFKPKGDEDTQ